MNERIRELADQANGPNPFYGTLKNQMTLLGNDAVERFAELMVRETLDQVAEFSRLTKAYQSQGIDPEIDITKEVLKNFGFTRFPRS